MLFGDMNDEPANEIHCRDSFMDRFIIFMPSVMKRNIIAVIIIDARCGNDRSSEITADIFYSDIGSTEVWFCSDIKTVRIFFI